MYVLIKRIKKIKNGIFNVFLKRHHHTSEGASYTCVYFNWSQTGILLADELILLVTRVDGCDVGRCGVRKQAYTRGPTCGPRRRQKRINKSHLYYGYHITLALYNNNKNGKGSEGDTRIIMKMRQMSVCAVCLPHWTWSGRN